MTETVKNFSQLNGNNKDTVTITWASLDADDSGKMIDLSQYADKTVQVIGTYNGATMTLYGSNDPRAVTDRDAGTLFGSATASWGVLTDTLGSNLAIASGNVPKQILQNPKYILPVNTGGGGSTSLTIIIHAHRNRF